MAARARGGAPKSGSTNKELIKEILRINPNIKNLPRKRKEELVEMLEEMQAGQRRQRAFDISRGKRKDELVVTSSPRVMHHDLAEDFIIL
eukprot:3883862-Heterocapsa_arctica.AAC.1